MICLYNFIIFHLKMSFRDKKEAKRLFEELPFYFNLHL